MKNDTLKLNGFRRFSLNGISEFFIRMDEPLQIVLGTNGCGKSSLLEQLCIPHIPDRKAFIEGGSMERTITHRGKQYVIKAQFTTSAKHYFEVDGEVLNDWGTAHVQKDLIRQYFGVDSKYHSFLSGQSRFHDMTALERREWFMEICDTDYTYALKVYGKVKEAHRDTQGALRTEQRKLAVESQKLLGDKERKDIAQYVSQLQALHTLMVENRTRAEDTSASLASQRQQSYSAVIAFADKALERHGNNQSWGVHHLPALNQRITNYGQKIAAAQALMQQAVSQHDKASRVLQAVQATGTQDAKVIRSQLNALRDKLQQTVPALLVDLGDTDPRIAIQTLDAVENNLIEVLAELPQNTQRVYSSQRLGEAQKELDALTVKRSDLQSTLARHVARLAHIESHGSDSTANCPKCQHTFTWSQDIQTVHKIQTDKQKIEQHLETVLQPKINEVMTYVTKCQTVAVGYRTLRTIQQGAHALQAYWDIWQDKGVQYDPQKGVNELQLIRQDLNRQVLVHADKQTCASLEKALQDTQLAGEKDLQSAQADVNRWEAALQKHTRSVGFYTDLKNSASNVQKRLVAIEHAYAYVNQGVEQAKAIDAKLLEHIRIEHYNRAMTDIQGLLGEKQHLLNQAIRQEEIVARIKQTIQQLTEEEKNLALAVQTLSPTDGIIADAMRGFIQAFVEQMNTIISSICTYPMQVLPCGFDGEASELNYKFPVDFEDGDPRPDVYNTSKGQREIIDLAFLITAMGYLRMTDYPLILDEIGSALDDTHLSKLVMFLTSLVQTASFEQIYMVSHHPHQYLGLSAQFCVLDPSNIVVPEVYNQHVTIK
jgi:hypothetical protein